MEYTILLDGGIRGIITAFFTQAVLAILLLVFVALGTTAIILHRWGKKSLGRALAITSAILGFAILCVSLALILPSVPPVDPSVFPSLNFDLLPTPTK